LSDQLRFLWLDGVFDEATVHSFPALSAASNLWQRGFVEALQKVGHSVDVFGYPAERIWPFGRLRVGGARAFLAPGLTGKVVGYLNFPFLRDTFQYVSLLATVNGYLRGAKRRPEYQVVYSCISKATEPTPSFRVAQHIRRRFGIPIICIVADGATPPGADGYVYLAWSAYRLHAEPGPAIHIDGGIPDVPRGAAPEGGAARCREKVLMYICLLYTSPSPRDRTRSRMPSSA
jgi:hypothetical protein